MSRWAVRPGRSTSSTPRRGSTTSASGPASATTLADVPAAEWDRGDAARRRRRVADGRVGAQPGGCATGARSPTRWPSFRAALADLDDADVIGSAYCIRRYEVDARFGGRDGLAAARAALADRGRAPARRLRAQPRRARPPVAHRASRSTSSRATPTTSPRDPASFLAVGDAVIARGRDPYFPPWPDVAQLNAFAPGLRQAAVDTLDRHRRPGRRGALRHGDADAQRRVRPHVGRAGRRRRRTTEYWTDVIAAVRAVHPGLRCSSPRPTGISSGSSSSSASTTATTSASTTACSTTAPARSAATSTPTSTTSGASSASSRTTTSRAPPASSRRPQDGPPRSSIATLPGRDAVARGPVRGLAGPRSGVPRPPPGRAGRRRSSARFHLSLVAVAARPPAGASGRCARPPAGPTTRAASSCWRGAGPTTEQRIARRRQRRRRARRPPGPPAVERPRRAHVAARRPPRRGRATNATGDDVATSGLYVGLDPRAFHVLRWTAVER